MLQPTGHAICVVLASASLPREPAAEHFRFLRAPDQLTSEELRAFQVHLLSAKTSWSQFNQIVCGLRFFYGTTLGRPEAVETLPYGKRPKVLPVVLSMEEVAQLLAAAKPGRERMLFETAYGCGLRISELLGLQVTDIRTCTAW